MEAKIILVLNSISDLKIGKHLQSKVLKQNNAGMELGGDRLQ